MLGMKVSQDKARRTMADTAATGTETKKDDDVAALTP